MDDNQSITLYVRPEEELTSVREQLEKTKAARVVLVIPPQTQLRSHVGWRLLHARMRELGKDVLIISSDRQIRAIAQVTGFRVAESLESPPLHRPRPSSRPSRSNRRGRTTPGSRQQAGSGSWERRFFKSGQQQMPPSSGKSDSTLSDSGELMETVPPPLSAATDREDEDIDTLIADYSASQHIREAAQGTGAGTVSPAHETQEPSSKTSLPAGDEADPFAYMEDQPPASLPEQRGSTHIEDLDAGIPDISDIPTDVFEYKIEDMGDEGEAVWLQDSSPRPWSEPGVEEPGRAQTPRVSGTPARQSRMGKWSIQDLDDEDELLLAADQPITPSPPAAVRSSATPVDNRGPQPLIQPPAREQTQANPGMQRTVSPPSSTQRRPDNLPVPQNPDTLISHRFEELRSTGVTLAKIAERLSVRALIVKILLIFLGALVATREVASGLFGITNTAVIVIYTLIGVLIATLAGLELAFRWENRSIELKNLAASTRAERRKLESAIVKDNTALASESLLDALDKQSSEAQEKAALLGVDISDGFQRASQSHPPTPTSRPRPARRASI